MKAFKVKQEGAFIFAPMIRTVEIKKASLSSRRLRRFLSLFR